MKKIIFGVITLLIIAGVIFALTNNSTPKTVSSVSTSSTPATTQPTATTPKTTTTSSPLSVTVNANDDSATPETISATKGQTVNLTFNVMQQGTYHGGLEFKSADPAIDSGPIAMGTSKTVTFTATKSFKFTPFWYASNVQKPYFVSVNVQ